jgi:putative ABC transport system permease protein
MFRNLFAATLRHFARNKFYTSINIIGLAVGLAAAILIAIFIRNELSFDRFLPGYERTYLLTETLQIGNEPLIWTPMSQLTTAAHLKLDYPAIEAVARLLPAPEPTAIRQGELEANEKLYWADPNIFDVLPFATIAGDLRTALQQPNSIVLTRRMARKYFHTDAPLGRTLTLDREHVMQVTAVLADLPSNTHLDTEIIASGRASFSTLARADANPECTQGSDWMYTYLRLAPGQSPAPLRADLEAFLRRNFPSFMYTPPLKVTFRLTPIASVHLAPIDHVHKLMKPGGDASAVSALAVVAVLVLCVAGINFVNLMTARAGRRAVEVGVRKSVGATRGHLILQFIGEAILQAAIAMVLALALVELLLPTLSAFVQQNLTFEYWREPRLALSLFGLTLLIGVLAGAYPAFVLSAFSPATVLKSGTIASAGSGRLRAALVVVQFAILIGLIVSTGVIWRQMHFAQRAGMRLNADQVLIVATRCKSAFRDEVLKLPGVRGAACASRDSMNLSQGHMPFRRRDGSEVFLAGASVDYGLFELYGIRPLAGRLFSRAHPADSLPDDFLEQRRVTDMTAARAEGLFVGHVVMNETAVRMYGFTSAREAVGQTMVGFFGHPIEVIGVVPDFAMDPIHKEVAPVVYGVFPPSFRYLNIKLNGRRLPETLDAIDSLWKRVGDGTPINRFFLDQHVQGLYLDVIRRGRIFAAFSFSAVLIACLGLFALSAFTAERRTKEIGVRKAMGAARSDILRLLVWQFMKPVLWANLIAWPVAALALHRWLDGFAYHVDLEPWVFVVAASLALLIAVATVSVHALLVAGANPARALRYD